MEGNKLDLTVSKKSPDEVNNATYKPLPTEDMESNNAATERVLTSTNSASAEETEKMLPNEDGMGDAKIVVSEKQNGDTKLTIGDLKDEFVGLTKEELLKYANDPFWIRIRWFLFITFWLLWGCMLVGAVVIIYAAPKCEPPAPKTWWEVGPLSKIEKFDTANIKDIKEKGIKGVFTALPGDSYAIYDDNHPFIKFLQSSINVTNVIVELDPTFTKVQEWFKKAEANDPEFLDYFIWAPETLNKSGIAVPPNNWVSTQNVTSWKLSKIKNNYYYAPNGEPHLNFRNEKVINEFSKVLEHLLTKGAAGIRLKRASQLLVDSKFENEPLNLKPTDLTLENYGFYTHSKTENVQDLGELLYKWRRVVKKLSNNGPFMVDNELSHIQAYTYASSLVVDLPPIQTVLKQSFNINAIVKALEVIYKTQAITWPLWTVQSSNSFPNDVLETVEYLLPGSPLVAENSKINADLVKLRESPTIMRGSLNYFQLANNTVFAFTRILSGSPAMLIAVNPTANKIILDFTTESTSISGDVSVEYKTLSFIEEGFELQKKHNANKIPLSPKSAVVLSYVPGK